jgi:hypothetical protein
MHKLDVLFIGDEDGSLTKREVRTSKFVFILKIHIRGLFGGIVKV